MTAHMSSSDGTHQGQGGQPMFPNTEFNALIQECMTDTASLPATIDHIEGLEAQIARAQARMKKLESGRRALTGMYLASVTEFEAAWRDANDEWRLATQLRADLLAEVDGLLR